MTFTDWAPIIATGLAGVGGVGSLLIWLVKQSAAGERAANAQTITVLKDAAKENRDEANRNRDAAAAEWQKTREALAAHTAAINSNTATMQSFMQFAGRASGRSGQTPAVGRRDDGGGE